MFAQLRSQLTYANVMATVAVFVALGGSAYAAATINGKNLKDRSVAGKKLKKNGVGGTEIKEAKLAKVPEAKLADSAGAANFASVAGSASNASSLGGKPASAFAAAGCPRGMVEVGAVCIDRYENSIWTAPSGGTQIKGAIPCAENGQDCKGKIFARSVAGVTPSTNITWFQAQQALANSGKRLPSSAEWQSAVAGTPDSTACNVNTAVVKNTGASAGCVSAWGASDMVGNLDEWVADWVATSTACPGWGGISDDRMCLSGAATSVEAPGALLRGGDSSVGTGAGPFAVDAGIEPSYSYDLFGFRGAR
jgi:formylglycine-generating enzyme required for sulfatase activity